MTFKEINNFLHELERIGLKELEEQFFLNNMCPRLVFDTNKLKISENILNLVIYWENTST